MLKVLIKIRLKGIFSRMVKGEKKEKKSGIGKIILYSLLFLYVFGVIFYFAYFFFDSAYPAFKQYGIQWLYFSIMAIVAILLSFIGSVFLAKQEIYDAKDNELLLSLPIKQMDILLSRVVVVLLVNYLYSALITLPAYVVYIQYEGISIVQVILFIVTFLILPLFTLSITCLFAWMIASLMKHVRNKNIFTIVSYLLFFGLYFFGGNAGGKYFNYLISQGQQVADVVKKVVPPIYYMAIGMQDSNLLSYSIFVVCMIVPFLLVMKLLSNNFIKLSLSKPKQKKIEYKEKEMKQQPLFQSLLKREWKHYCSNPMVVLNGSMGIIFNIIGIGGFILYRNNILEALQLDATILRYLKEIVVPIVIVALSYCTSLNMISCTSISLEGNRLWILKSLPIKTFDILIIKVLFHILLCVPTQIIFSLVVSIGLGLDIISILLSTLVPFLLICLVAFAGLLINLWKPKFDWVNETVVVKQSMSIVITMFGTMGFVLLVIASYFMFLDTMISMYEYCYVVFVLLLGLNILCLRLLQGYGVKRFESYQA